MIENKETITMKKIYTILAITALIASSCAKELVPSAREAAGYEHNGKVTFNFTPDFGDCGDATRSLGLNPDVQNIYFAVFDAAGYKLAEYAEAVPNTYATTNAPDKYSYSVELTITDQPRIIHIIANAPDQIPYGSEAEVIGSLCTYFNAAEGDDIYNRKDAYWERIYLENGVWAKPEDDLATTKPDEYAAQYAKYKEVVDILNTAELIRNFAQINVVNNSDDFLLTGFWLTNTPDRGSVAPYNRNTGLFQTDYRNFTNVNDLRAVDNGNYQGFMPGAAKLNTIEGLDVTELNASKIEIGASEQTTGKSAFCYEREVPKNNPLYVIIAGKYNNSSEETYYKIDLRDSTDSYFPILRNFNYRINIKKVLRAGASSVEGVLSAAPSGDITTSLDLSDLTNMSDGIAQIFVSETSEVVVGTNDVQLRYKFIPNVSNGTAANITKEQWEAANPGKTIDVEGTNLDGYHPNYVTITREAESAGPAFNGVTVATTDEDEDAGYYRLITLKPNEPSSVIKTETVTITGHYWRDGEWNTISRAVTYRLREKLNMQVSCTPSKVPNSSINQQVDVKIKLETGLPSSIFSLDMVLEAANLSVSTNNAIVGQELPVASGQSTIPNVSKPAFFFTRTITWTEYENAPVVDGYKVFTASFKTNKIVASDQIYVSNKYFNQASTSYTTFGPKYFGTISFSGSMVVGSEATAAYGMDAFPGGATSYTVQIGMKGMEPAPSEAGRLSFIGENEEGFEVYEMTVTSNTGNSFKVVPYKAGTSAGTIKLYADEYISKSASADVLSGPVTVYADVYRDNASATDFVTLSGTDVTGTNNIVVGQSATLYFYLSEASGTVKIDGKNATRVTSGSGSQITVEGKTLYLYKTENSAYTAPNGNAQIDQMDVTYNGSLIDRISLPVYGIKLENKLTSISFNTSKYYIIQNNSTKNYLYNNESTNNASQILKDTYDFTSLVKFGNTTSTSTIAFVKNGSNNQYYFGSSNYNNVALSTSSYAWTITDTFRLSYYRNNYYGYYYVFDNSGSVSMSNSNNTRENRYWNIYPVTFVAPTAL